MDGFYELFVIFHPARLQMLPVQDILKQGLRVLQIQQFQDQQSVDVLSGILLADVRDGHGETKPFREKLGRSLVVLRHEPGRKRLF